MEIETERVERQVKKSLGRMVGEDVVANSKSSLQIQMITAFRGR